MFWVVRKKEMNVFVSLKLLKVSMPREEKKNSLKRFKGGWFGTSISGCFNSETIRHS